MKNITNHAIIRYFQRFLDDMRMETNDDLSKYCKIAENKKFVNILKVKLLRFFQDTVLISENEKGIQLYYNNKENIIFVTSRNRVISLYKPDGISYDKAVLDMIFMEGDTVSEEE